MKRVVVTNSFSAIAYGHVHRTATYTEEDWSILDGLQKVAAYPKSKTIAERAAWDFMQKEGGDMTLATVNPVAVFGPVLSADFAVSVEIITRFLNGQFPAIPKVVVGAVDVRDVADLHLRAMTDPKAAGQRFVACADGDLMSLKDIAISLKKDLSEKEGKKISLRSLPGFVLRIAALFDAAVGLIVPELGLERSATSAKAKSELGWSPRSSSEAVLACARSLIDLGVVKV